MKNRRNSGRQASNQPSVYSYYSRRRPEGAKEAKSSSLWKRLKRTPFSKLIIGLAVIVIIGFLLSVSPRSIIRSESSQTPIRDISVYRATADEMMRSSLLNRTKLTFAYRSFSDEMKKLYPELKSVSTSFDVFGRRPVVTLQFYEPTFRVTSHGQEWVVDERGVAITESHKGSDEKITALPLITDAIGLISKAGDHLMTPDDIAFIAMVKSLLAEKGINVKNTTIPLVPRELDVNLEGESISYKLNLDEPVREQVGALLAARDTLWSKNEIPGEYIDLRAGEKVYWR